MGPGSTKSNRSIFTPGMLRVSAVRGRSCAKGRGLSRSAPLVVGLALGCSSGPSQWQPASPPERAERASASTTPLAVESGPAETRRAPDTPEQEPRTLRHALPVEGFGDAVVIVPLSDARVPLLIGAHGAGDTPEWQCEHWDTVARGRFLVLCPRGLPLARGDDSAYYFANHHELEREVVAAVRAVRSAFGDRLAETGGVYTGYSQGATMGALMIVDHGAEFPHLLLVEGGSGDWTLGRARRFHATGGKSVAIVCGTPGCAKRGKRSVSTLERAGLRARVEHVEGGGHTYIGGVGERARELLDGWLLQSD